MKFLITGGTGFIGTHLTKRLLLEGHEVLILSRSEKQSNKHGLRYVKWDGTTIPPDTEETDVVINLAGASIADRKWTASYKETILDSRVNATKACVEYINRCSQTPSLFLSGSAVGFYGGFREAVVDEHAEPGEDFMGSICAQWEDASANAKCRTVILRTPVVLGKDDGPFPVMLKPFYFFVGGPIGSGKQGLPWIHIEDMVEAVLFLIDQPAISGPVNVSAPQIITQKKFAKTIGKILKRPAFNRVPRFMLNMLMGERAIIAWGGQKVKNTVLEKAGFNYRFPEISGAIQNLLGK